MVADLISRILKFPYLIQLCIGVAGSIIAIYLTGIGSRITDWAGSLVDGEFEYSAEDRNLRIKWIAKGIDPILDQLNGHSQRFPMSDDPVPSKIYDQIEAVEYDKSIIHDLDNQGYHIEDQLIEYNKLIEEYLEKRSFLKNQLKDYFFETNDHLLRSANTVKNRNHAEKVSEAVMISSNPKTSVGWIGDNEDLIKAINPTLRSKPEFRNEFDELDSLTESIEVSRGDLADQLNTLREKYAGGYEITETEIEELK